MADLKREYVVPLRRKTRTAPKWRRSKKSVSVLKEFMQKHMKTDDIIVCSELNEYIWNNGAKNPPGKVSVTALRTEVNGELKTIVNLSSVGIDKQKDLYKAQISEVKAPIEAEAKEVPKENVKTEEKTTLDETLETKAEVESEKKEDVKNG